MLRGEGSAVGESGVCEYLHPVGATLAAVLRAVFVTVGAGFSFGQTRMPAYGVNTPFFPAGVCPYRLPPPTPRACQVSWGIARMCQLVLGGKSDIALVEKHSTRLRFGLRLTILALSLVGTVGVIARGGDIALISFLIAYIHYNNRFIYSQLHTAKQKIDTTLQYALIA